LAYGSEVASASGRLAAACGEETRRGEGRGESDGRGWRDGLVWAAGRFGGDSLMLIYLRERA
jgi:hypothetical protein